MYAIGLEQIEVVLQAYKGWLQASLASQPLLFEDPRLRSKLPSEGGVYRIFEKGADWRSSVYVGKSGNLQNRIYRSHLMGNQSVSPLKRKLIQDGRCTDEKAVKRYLRDNCMIQFVLINDEAERMWFEHFAIAVLKPLYDD